MNKAQIWSGLDIGAVNEFTAFAIVERVLVRAPEQPKREFIYSVRFLERFAPGTGYHDIVARLTELYTDPSLRGTNLAVDITAVGRPVFKMLKEARVQANSIRAINITNGHQSHHDPHCGWLVPKKELVSTLQILLQSRRLKVASTLSDAVLLTQELSQFKAKVSLNTDEMDSWREREHDDLVLAVAMACWWAERIQIVPSERPFSFVVKSPI